MATRLVGSAVSVLGCPVSISYNKTHGPSAPIANVSYDLGLHSVVRAYTPVKPVNVLLTTVSINCDRSDFYGFVTTAEITTDDSSGKEILTLSIAEWRDRLHDYFVFGAFNMIESNGVCWHIMPGHYNTQVKSYITKELDQVDFDELQNLSTATGAIEVVSKDRLLSAATIMNMIALQFSFNWTADSVVMNVLMKSKPFNIDWQQGVSGADALEDLLSRMNMRWTTSGTNTVVVTLKGSTTNLFFEQFLDFRKRMCSYNGRYASAGEEINEQGRNILIVGERNRYQFVFPCQMDWNPRFTFRLCYDGWSLAKLLDDNNLTPLSKIKDLPPAYHDKKIWHQNADGFGGGNTPGGGHPNKKLRMEMPIYQYIKDVCFKSYRIDFGHTCRDVKLNAAEINSSAGSVRTIDKRFLRSWPSTEDQHKEKPINEYPFNYPGRFLDGAIVTPTTPPYYDGTPYDGTPTGGFYYNDYNSLWPLSQSLVTDSNVQFYVLHTTRKILANNMTPFEEQRFFVPTNDGVSLESHEIIMPNTGQMEYYMRLVFSDIQFRLLDLADWKQPNKIEPDAILAVISLDKEIYMHEQGIKTGPKVRTQKHAVKSLYQSFVDELEVIFLAENYQWDMAKGGTVPAMRPVYARDIAKKIADHLLFHFAINKMGSMRFNHTASHQPDGVIENISVNFSDSDGISETVNFSRTRRFHNLAPIPPSVYRVSRELKTESKVNRERLESIAKQVMTQLKVDAGKGLTSFDFYTILGDMSAAASCMTKSIFEMINAGRNTIAVEHQNAEKIDEATGSIIVVDGNN